MKLRRIAAYLVVILCGLSGFAQTPKVERISTAPESLSHDVTAALEDHGYRVTLDDGWSAELWLAKNPKLTSGADAEALYPQLSNGEFIAVLHLPKGMTDFRGQAVPAGTYTLRYQLLPQDGNHLGVAPNPDFLLAIPAASDTKSDAVYPFDKLVALSAKSTGAHPAVIAMEKAGEPGTATFDDQKLLILTVSISSTAGKPEPVGIVLKGQATQ
ncbi:MAG: hypothetical protein WAM71_16755 [Candidatus Korobacteraceae bacterium]